MATPNTRVGRTEASRRTLRRFDLRDALSEHTISTASTYSLMARASLTARSGAVSTMTMSCASVNSSTRAARRWS